MKQLLLCLFMALALPTSLWAQYDFEPSKKYPYGRPNPEAPAQITDWAEMIGECECDSDLRNPDGTWAKTEKIIWRWKYIMNGHGVQDETLKPDGSYTGSVRQFIADSSRWYVHFYSHKGPSPSLPTWEGNREDGKITLYKDQTAPNGMEGKYKIVFYDMSESGYKWEGAWVNPDETIVYPTWRISCTR